MARGQSIAAGNFRFTGSTTAEGLALCKQLRSSGPMNCAIDSSAAEKRRVGSVYDRIHVQFRDVAADDFDVAHNGLFQRRIGFLS